MVNFKGPHCLLLLCFSHDGNRENQDPGKPRLFQPKIEQDQEWRQPQRKRDSEDRKNSEEMEFKV